MYVQVFEKEDQREKINGWEPIESPNVMAWMKEQEIRRVNPFERTSPLFPDQ